MDINELKMKIIEADLDAIDIIDTADNKEDALGTIQPFLSDTNEDIRYVAVECLIMIPSSEVNRLLAKVLSDPNKSIRARALQALFPSTDVALLPDLLPNLTNPDPEIAIGVAQIAGYIGDRSAVPPLRKQLEKEKNERVHRQILLTLGRLGENDAQDSIAEWVKNPEPKTRSKVLDDIRYVNSEKIAPYLYYALYDTDKCKNIGSKNNPLYARVLDVAITLAAELLETLFSFDSRENSVYTMEELEEARNVLKKMVDEVENGRKQ